MRETGRSAEQRRRNRRQHKNCQQQKATPLHASGACCSATATLETRWTLRNAHRRSNNAAQHCSSRMRQIICTHPALVIFIELIHRTNKLIHPRPLVRQLVNRPAPLLAFAAANSPQNYQFLRTQNGPRHKMRLSRAVACACLSNRKFVTLQSLVAALPSHRIMHAPGNSPPYRGASRDGDAHQ